jgi:MOSC domain-containing protein YiiM
MFIGQPQVHVDERGEWRSSIFRAPVAGPLELGLRGLAGDQVTDTKNHGSPDQAVCCHPLDHYAHWNAAYGLTGARALGPGSVGENWTLAEADEAEICVGDVYAVGAARIAVSGPRIPCAKQDRRTGIPGFHRAAGEALRTGFYLRVLQPGTVAAGDAWALVERPQPDITVREMNEAWHGPAGTVRAARIERMLAAPAVNDEWKRLYAQRLRE